MDSKNKYIFNIVDFQRADERALEYIFATYWRGFVYFAKRYVSDLEAEDVCSEVMNRVWARRFDFHSLNGLKAFIYVSIRNASIDLIRSKKMTSRVDRDYSYLNAEALSPNGTEEMLARIVQAGVLQRLHEMRERLPPQIGKVIQLTLEGESVSSIAAKMGIARQVVHRYKVRGIELLREGLDSTDPLDILLIILLVGIIR